MNQNTNRVKLLQHPYEKVVWIFLIYDTLLYEI